MVVDLNARRHMATHAQSKRGRQGKEDNAKLSLIKCPRTTKLRASLNRPGTERLGCGLPISLSIDPHRFYPFEVITLGPQNPFREAGGG